MSDSTSEPADDVPYENTTDLVWAQKAFDLYKQRRLQVQAFETEGVVSAQVWGTCPRCEHDDLNFQPILNVPVADLRQGRGLWSALTGHSSRHGPGIPPTVEVGCGCGRTHPGAPGQVKGCGVSFRLPTTAPTDAPQESG